jgi:hypothetical protein
MTSPLSVRVLDKFVGEIEGWSSGGFVEALVIGEDEAFVLHRKYSKVGEVVEEKIECGTENELRSVFLRWKECYKELWRETDSGLGYNLDIETLQKASEEYHQRQRAQ